MKNDTNNAAKRTAAQVASILRSNGLDAKPENSGDGRTFWVAGSDIKTRVAVKSAGFILCRSAAGDTGILFQAF